MLGQKRSRCELIPEPEPEPPCYVQLGRFGDLMIILPGLLHRYQREGIKPVVMTCLEFAPLLEGCSYVQPFPVWDIPWNTGARRGVELARTYYREVVTPKWWDAHLDPPPPRDHEPRIELDWQGRRLIVSQDEWNSYQYSQWKACGWGRQEILDWPLVFDRRSRERETWLAGVHLHPRKPNVLYNFTGISNAMPFEPEIMRAVAGLRQRVNFVDLGRIRASHLQDLLGLYDRAICVISGDTATLHLAAASQVPLIALQADGWAGSLIKGNEILRLRYHQVRGNVGRIAEAIEKLL